MQKSTPHLPKIDVLMGTFGKAIGTQGAFIAGSNELVEYMVNFSKHYVYSTAMPAAQARATRTSLQIMRKGIEREALNQNIAVFKMLAAKAGLPILSVDGPIQPIVIGDPVKALALSHHLKSLGIWVNAIRSPTVPKHSDRLRITISALHQAKDIHALVDALSIAMGSLISCEHHTTGLDNGVSL
jgi:8-amino-7-oxononanoate synthase